MELDFSKQKYRIIIDPRPYGDLEYKQRANWNSKNRLQRERANLMFNRLEQSISNIANDINTNSVSTGFGNQRVYKVTDGFARIIYEPVLMNNEIVIIIREFLWDYKKDRNSWWSIVENFTHHLNESEETPDRFRYVYYGYYISSELEKGKFGSKHISLYLYDDSCELTKMYSKMMKSNPVEWRPFKVIY